MNNKEQILNVISDRLDTLTKFETGQEDALPDLPNFITEFKVCEHHPFDSTIYDYLMASLNDAVSPARNFWHNDEPNWLFDSSTTYVRYCATKNKFLIVPSVFESDRQLMFQLTFAAEKRLVARFIQDHLLEADQMILEAKQKIQDMAKEEFSRLATSPPRNLTPTPSPLATDEVPPE